MVLPNVRSWAVGILQPLSEIVKVNELPKLVIRPSKTPPVITVKPPIGTELEQRMTFDLFREEYPLLRSAFYVANELMDRTNPGTPDDLALGPTFDELIEIVLKYFKTNLIAKETMDPRDVGIWYWRKGVLDILENGIRASASGVRGIPILGSPPWLDTALLPRFQWTGVVYKGKKTHTNLVACHNNLEGAFASFLDSDKSVLRYLKNERFGFSITYYEGNRPRQYYPDFIVVHLERPGKHTYWLAETKGEITPNTRLKSEAAEIWCKKMSGSRYGEWRYLLVPEQDFEHAVKAGVKTFAFLAKRLRALDAARVLTR